jgi:hypothetical protein
VNTPTPGVRPAGGGSLERAASRDEKTFRVGVLLRRPMARPPMGTPPQRAGYR